MRGIALAILIAGLILSSRLTATQLPELRDSREKHLANVKQLTFGGQNAEAYWSSDGRKLIFQSTRDELKADQQFVMDADGSNVKMVSNGKGRTTCGYFLKNGREIIYSSTHAYSEAAPLEPDRSQGYVWPIYPYYTLFKANVDGSNCKPLLPTEVGPGKETAYNAEATVSPDGKTIVFTSTRDGDLDLYTMSVDGKNVRRITSKLGYDGGAFFSHDSKRLIWRANHPESDSDKADYQALLRQNLVRPSRMELWTANADGSDARQITKFGKACFAPYFTPDDKRIIFSSNMDDPRGRTFELYLIDLDGTRLERVTWGGQFNAFPMFRPDGKKLVWASNRHGKVPHETNIFVADWVP